MIRISHLAVIFFLTVSSPTFAWAPCAPFCAVCEGVSFGVFAGAMVGGQAAEAASAAGLGVVRATESTSIAAYGVTTVANVTGLYATTSTRRGINGLLLANALQDGISSITFETISMGKERELKYKNNVSEIARALDSLVEQTVADKNSSLKIERNQPSQFLKNYNGGYAFNVLDAAERQRIQQYSSDLYHFDLLGSSDNRGSTALMLENAYQAFADSEYGYLSDGNLTEDNLANVQTVLQLYLVDSGIEEFELNDEAEAVVENRLLAAKRAIVRSSPLTSEMRSIHYENPEMDNTALLEDLIDLDKLNADRLLSALVSSGTYMGSWSTELATSEQLGVQLTKLSEDALENLLIYALLREAKQELLVKSINLAADLSLPGY